MGMPYDLYWYGDPQAVVFYRKANELHNERRNQELWLQGLYIYNAFGAVLGNAFAKKGSKKLTYLEKPIEIQPKPKAQQEIEAEQERQKVINNLTAWKKSWDKAKNQGGIKHDDRKP